MDLKVLYEDDFIIAVNKPSGITTIPGNDQPRSQSLAGEIEEYCGRKIFVVHRLDRETSGVIIFAKTPEAHRNINLQFDQRKVEKHYIALVEGKCIFDEKEINIPLSKSKSRSKKPALASKGIEAITRIKVFKRFANYTLLEVIPVTGRRHQIRLHLKAIGHPLAYDRLYGNKESLTMDTVTGRQGDENIVLDRMPLHSKSISFMHPDTGKMIAIVAGLLEDMAALC